MAGSEDKSWSGRTCLAEGPVGAPLQAGEAVALWASRTCVVGAVGHGLHAPLSQPLLPGPELAFMDLTDIGRADGDLPWAASAATGPGSTQCCQSPVFSLWTRMSLMKTCLDSVPIHSVPPPHAPILAPALWFALESLVVWVGLGSRGGPAYPEEWRNMGCSPFFQGLSRSPSLAYFPCLGHLGLSLCILTSVTGPEPSAGQPELSWGSMEPRGACLTKLSASAKPRAMSSQSQLSWGLSPDALWICQYGVKTASLLCTVADSRQL